MKNSILDFNKTLNKPASNEKLDIVVKYEYDNTNPPDNIEYELVSSLKTVLGSYISSVYFGMVIKVIITDKDTEDDINVPEKYKKYSGIYHLFKTSGNASEAIEDFKNWIKLSDGNITAPLQPTVISTGLILSNLDDYTLYFVTPYYNKENNTKTFKFCQLQTIIATEGNDLYTYSYGAPYINPNPAPLTIMDESYRIWQVSATYMIVNGNTEPTIKLTLVRDPSLLKPNQLPNGVGIVVYGLDETMEGEYILLPHVQNIGTSSNPSYIATLKFREYGANARDLKLNSLMQKLQYIDNVKFYSSATGKEITDTAALGNANVTLQLLVKE